VSHYEPGEREQLYIDEVLSYLPHTKVHWYDDWGHWRFDTRVDLSYACTNELIKNIYLSPVELSKDIADKMQGYLWGGNKAWHRVTYERKRGILGMGVNGLDSE
jgi:hypothetical protein